ncbi:MAG: PD-(D/E)XK nuclease family protein, partial [Eudoraea sp.]|nr:PD-(D/E)XK nuclease family protein [Eudoraea sp.]
MQQKEIRIVGVPKQVSQAKYIGNILRNMEEDAPEELNKTALILGDEKLLNPILNSLPPALSPVNITMGYPLGETTIAGLFLKWMDFFISQDREGWYFQYFTEFLVHPLVQLLLTRAEENEASMIRENIIENNVLFIRFEDLEKMGLQNTQEIEILFSDKKHPSNFLQDGQALLKALRNRIEDHADPITVQESVLLSQVLQELDITLQLYPYIKDIKALKGLFLEQLRTKNLDFIGSPTQGLQIMGMLESRNLDFDTVIITSVNEGILPAGKTVNSFIPFDVKRELGLPTYKEKDAVYTYHFYRILQRAKNIVICYNTEPDVLEGGEKSRLIYQLTTDPNIAPYITEEIASPQVPLKTKSPLVVPKDNWVLDKISALAERGFSPTVLTDYIRDPLIFFKRHILNIDDPEEVEESLEAKTFGILIHQALEILYAPFLGQVLTPDGLAAQKDKIRPLINKLMSEIYPGQKTLTGKNLIACEVIIKYLHRFLDLEIEQSKGHIIRLLALEKRIKQAYPIPGMAKPVALKGTVDRVDEFDGQVRILDYKTGSVKAAEVEIVSWDSLIQDKDKNKAFQLLCYALFYSRKMAIEGLQAGIISMKSPQGGPVNFATKSTPRSKTKDSVISGEVLQLFEMQLQELIKEISDPQTPF